MSIDFGGGYQREANFFRQFDPCILRTNIRSKSFFRKLEAESWQFMGIGAVLFSEKLCSSYFVFGSILEAEVNLNADVDSKIEPFYSTMGLQCILPTKGLTEVGTAKIACYYNSKMINASLESLSKPGSTKRLRKDLLARIFIENVEIHAVSGFKFGQDYVFDFLLFYCIKHLGVEFVGQYIDNIPEEVVEIAHTFDLMFYERLNPKNLITFPDSAACNAYLSSLFKAGIDLYDKNDYCELAAIREWLAIYYKQPNGHIRLYCDEKHCSAVRKKICLADIAYSLNSWMYKIVCLFSKLLHL